MARTQARGNFEQAGRQAGLAVRSAVHNNPWLGPLARFGYAARGVVYAVVGLLAIQTAFGGRGQTTGQEGALQRIAEQSRILLVLITIGLAGYALWRFVQAVLDPENKGTDPKGMAQRLMMVASGIVYSGLAITAARLASGGGGGGTGGEGSQGFTADLMSKPFGRWLVVLGGLAVIVAGLYQLKEAYTKKFRDRLQLQKMNADEQRLATHTGQLGLSARGIVFLITGWFLIQAGLRFDSSQARGLGGALETLASQPHGPWLLGLVALGLIAYGAYSFLQARYRRIVF